MNTSIFLGKLFGYLLVLISLHIFFRKQHFKVYAQHMIDNPGLINLLSLLRIIMGILLLLFHNIWAADWGIVVTLLSWVVLLKGLYGFFSPEGTVRLAKKLIESRSGLCIIAIINAVIGAYLLVMAYTY